MDQFEPEDFALIFESIREIIRLVMSLSSLTCAVILLLATPLLVLSQELHWAYRRIEPTIPPHAEAKSTAGAIRNAIDAFILRRVKEQGLHPANPANRATLIRRVSLDLIGLPPDPGEVADFIEDDREDAYDRLVDRLLSSPHYGERWARPWLDLCHYADTDGYLTDQERPVAWRYRAWLVNSLNQNMPFDQFTIEQLAGDLLPDATIDQRSATGILRQTLSNREGGADPEEFRVKQVVDRTTMLGEIWLGLTVGCAQCHDHKYDDLTQQEFYQLYAFFNTADEINVDAPLAHERDAYHAALPDYQQKRQELLAPRQAKLNALKRRWEHKLLEARDYPGRDWYWDRQWELLGLVWGGNLGEGQLEGWRIVELAPEQRTQLQKDRLLDYFLPQADSFDNEQAKQLDVASLNSELKQLKALLPPVTRAPTMMETQMPRDTYIHVAGDFRAPGDQVLPNTPAVLPPLRGRDRLDLAKWLVSSVHPLTARVAVNRMWQAFFGVGIVSTSGDFGVRGGEPLQPQLLDWLAQEYIASGWDTKHMHRLIVTSATYRQSARAADGQPSQQDRWLAKQRPIRLTAEQIRDSVLRVSGLWDARIGGLSVRPPQPASVTEQSYQNKWNLSQGGDRYRRSLYTWVQRTSPFAMHITFDAPNPNHICARRDRSNTPLQALTLLNEPVFYEAARALAQQVSTELDSDRARIVVAFKRALVRAPNSDELAVLETLLEELRKDADRSSEPWTVLCSVMLNLHEFITRN